jgi:tRNA A37 threonylcarbamoyladenosine biosynthesis protein TsaE
MIGLETILQPQRIVCRECGQTYHADNGFTRYCPRCTDTLLALEHSKKSQPSWNHSWPERAKSDSLTASGPGMNCAVTILPMLSNGGVVVLCGDRGTGKTVMATWLAGRMRTGTYVKAYDLFAHIKGSWSEDSKITELQALDYWRSPRLLVIDEAQERGDTEWENRILANLVDHRYDDLKSTIIITNQSAEKTAQTLGSSITRRANQTGGLIPCDWPSYV